MKARPLVFPPLARKVLLHILFWILTVIYFAWGFGLNVNPGRSLLNSALYLPGFFLMVYSLLYVLVPRFLLKKKLISFFIGLGIVLSICMIYSNIAQLGLDASATLRGMTLKVKCGISSVESMLPHNRFLRIHRSYIVSVSRVTAFTTSDVEIGTRELPIGRSYHEVFNKLTSGHSVLRSEEQQRQGRDSEHGSEPRLRGTGSADHGTTGYRETGSADHGTAGYRGTGSADNGTTGYREMGLRAHGHR